MSEELSVERLLVKLGLQTMQIDTLQSEVNRLNEEVKLYQSVLGGMADDDRARPNEGEDDAEEQEAVLPNP